MFISFYNYLSNMIVLKKPYVLEFLLLLILFAVIVCIIYVMCSSNKKNFKEGSNKSLKPYMTNNEIILLEKYYRNSKNYFEFGSGGSTVYAIKNNIENIESVETDNDWVNRIKKDPLVSNKLKEKKLKIHMFPLNFEWTKAVSWKPNYKKYLKTCDKSNWNNYSKIIRKCDLKLDLVLVDGRFRVASCLETIKKVDNNCFILIHDYRQQKSATSIRGYEFVEKYLDIIEFKDNLYVFKKKQNINFMELEMDLEKYNTIPN